MSAALHIIYASTSGNVEGVCVEVSDLLKAKGQAVQLHRAEVTHPDILINNPYFILATSTWEHGRINPYWDKLLEEIKNLDLSHKLAGFVGLGDTRYEPILFCAGIDELLTETKKKGMSQVGTPLKINGNPFNQMDRVKAWTEEFYSELAKQSHL